MKICPKCRQVYDDAALNFCLNDGANLVPYTESPSAETVAVNTPPSQIPTAQYSNPPLGAPTTSNRKNSLLIAGVLGGVVLLCGGLLGGYFISDITKPVGNTVVQNRQPSNVIAKKTPTDVNANAANNVANANGNTNINTTTAANANQTNAAPVPAGSRRLTSVAYEKLEMGISYRDAVGVLGSEGVETSSSGKAGSGGYRWVDGEKSIGLQFIDDKLVSKSQMGLTSRVNPSVNLAKYNQIKNGMTYDEVTAILGEGTEINRDSFGNSDNASYVWKPGLGMSLFVTFKNGKSTSKSQSGLK